MVKVVKLYCHAKHNGTQLRTLCYGLWINLEDLTTASGITLVCTPHTYLYEIVEHKPLTVS